MCCVGASFQKSLYPENSIKLSGRFAMSKVGFIDLGVMGRPMAGRLIAGGHTLFVHSRSGASQVILNKGAVECGNGKEVAEHADAIITMLPDTPKVAVVLFGGRHVPRDIDSPATHGLKFGSTVHILD
jgi:2-hydroxy-3-oxopropionate reductase